MTKLTTAQQSIVDIMQNQKLCLKLRKMTGFQDSFSFEKIESGGYFSSGHISTNTVKALIRSGVLVEFETSINFNYTAKYRISETFLKTQQNESKI